MQPSRYRIAMELPLSLNFRAIIRGLRARQTNGERLVRVRLSRR
jgi:hypothetical protein